MRFVDLTHPTDQNQLPFPGDPTPLMESVCTHPEDGCMVTRLSISTHQGTHVDAPLHFMELGTPIDQIPLSTFFGPAYLIDMTEAPDAPANQGKPITIQQLQRHAEMTPEAFRFGARLLLRTGWAGHGPTFDAPGLDSSAAHWLAERRIGLLGLDIASPSRDECNAVHRLLLGGMYPVIVIENMDLSSELPSQFTLSAFPLRLAGCEASPVRAVAIIES